MKGQAHRSWDDGFLMIARRTQIAINLVFWLPIAYVAVFAAITFARLAWEWEVC